MFCRFCGANIPDDSAFCTKCGQKLITEAQAARGTVQPQPQLQIQPQSGMPYAPLDRILKELDGLVGLEAAKKAVHEMVLITDLRRRRPEGFPPIIHCVFSGNPGTGKTTVARIMGKLFKEIGLLPSDKVVDTDRAGLVANYVGQTAQKTNSVCDQAMGGILFIDDAYTLGGMDGHSDPFAQEAVETLLKRMENDRGKFIVIAAGYKEEMDAWLNNNPGLKSRFSCNIHFEDYNPDELFAIFNSMVAQESGQPLSGPAAEKAKQMIKDIYDKRGKGFANAREMRRLLEERIHVLLP